MSAKAESMTLAFVESKNDVALNEPAGRRCRNAEMLSYMLPTLATPRRRLRHPDVVSQGRGSPCQRRGEWRSVAGRSHPSVRPPPRPKRLHIISDRVPGESHIHDSNGAERKRAPGELPGSAATTHDMRAWLHT